MKYFIIFMLLFQMSYGQIVNYKYYNNSALLRYELKIDKKNGISLWNRKMDAWGEITTPTTDFVRKDNTFYFKDKTPSKKYNVKDEPALVWEKQDKKVKFLGYECNVATTYFRGRKYTAYYTPKIELDDGPWKFHRLEGLILYIKSADGDYIFEAENIGLQKKNDLKKEAEDFIENTQFITWTDYSEKYKKDVFTFIDEQKCNCPKDGTSTLRISKIEKIIPNLHDAGIPY